MKFMESVGSSILIISIGCGFSGSVMVSPIDISDIPDIILGAEVYFFSGISRSQHIDGLKTEGTSLFLLEMPFQTWSYDMISEMIELNSRKGYKVILAHFERYYPFQHKSIWEEIKECGIIIQSNAEYFIDKKTRKKAIKHLETGLIDIIGSDCHNTDSRPPNIGEAFDIIGKELSDLLIHNNSSVLDAYNCIFEQIKI